jgi:DNA-directed RNA polymerase specialized sigma24 family protein
VGLLGRGVDVSTGARAASSPITAEQLADVWPDLQRRLTGYLRRRGCSSDDAQDITQEIGLRLLTVDVHYQSLDQLLPWCLTVARNLHIDGHRRAARYVVTDSVVDAPSHEDVPTTVEDRVRLERTLRCFALLAPGDRQALRPIPLGVQTRTRKEAVRDNVRRLRARQRLLRMVEGGVAALLGLLSTRTRSVKWNVAVCAVALPVALAAWSQVQRAPFDPLVLTQDGSQSPAAAVARPSARTVPPTPLAADGQRDLVEAVGIGQRGRLANDIEVSAPGSIPVLRVVTRDSRSDDSVVCLHRLPVLDQLCVGALDAPVVAAAHRTGALRARSATGVAQPGGRHIVETAALEVLMQPQQG